MDRLLLLARRLDKNECIAGELEYHVAIHAGYFKIDKLFIFRRFSLPKEAVPIATWLVSCTNLGGIFQIDRRTRNTQYAQF